MNAHPHGPEPHEEAFRVAGALYSALMAARPFVEATLDRRRGILADEAASADAELLDRIDGALADAGELFPGVIA